MTDQRPLIDDDPAVERLLRRAFADDADRAPTSTDLHGLADGAVRRGRHHRRRTAAAAALVSVAVVASVAVVGNLERPQSSDAVPGTGRTTPTPLPPTPPSNAGGQPVLMFRGAEVPVPAAMLDPDAVRCGTAVRDAAYVVDRVLPVEACSIDIDDSGFTTVVMQPLEDVPEADRKPGGRTLPDGRYQVASALPLADVWLTVTSPDQARADRLFGSVTVNHTVRTCDLHSGRSPEVERAGPLVPTLGPGAIGAVCGYRSGWLTGATLLGHQEAVELADLIAAAPSDALLDCATDVRTGDGWWVTVGDQRVWVEAGTCSRVIGETGGSGLLTSDLMSRLWQLAAGPGSATGVVSPKN